MMTIYVIYFLSVVTNIKICGITWLRERKKDNSWSVALRSALLYLRFFEIEFGTCQLNHITL